MYLNKNINEGKKFLNSLNKLVSNISQESWINHIERIRNSENEPIYPQDNTEDGSLDYEIMVQELLDASPVLKNGKASGTDMTSHEMLKCDRLQATNTN